MSVDEHGTSPERAAERRTPWPLREWAFEIVVVATLVGVVMVAAGSFTGGCLLVAAALLVGALLRALLSTEAAGLLRVRSRVTDCLILTTLGVALGVLAVVVPPTA